MKLFRKIAKTSLMIFLFLAGIAVVGIFGLYCYSLKINLNQDNVALGDGTWKKVCAFIPAKSKVVVEIFGRPTGKPNEGDFVVRRSGVVPFGVVLISPRYCAENIWKKQYLVSEKYGTPPHELKDPVDEFKIQIGYFHDQQFMIKKFKFLPSL